MSQIREIQLQLDKAPDEIKLGQEISSLKEEISRIKINQEESGRELKEFENKIKEKERYGQEAEKSKIMLFGKRELIAGWEKEKSVLKKQLEEVKNLGIKDETVAHIAIEKYRDGKPGVFTLGWDDERTTFIDPVLSARLGSGNRAFDTRLFYKDSEDDF